MPMSATFIEMEGEFPELDDEDDDLFISQVNLEPPWPSPDNFNENSVLKSPDTPKKPPGKRSLTSPLNGGLNNRLHDHPKVTHASKVLNASRSSSTKTPKRFSRRKFPGPAGVLPMLKPPEFDLLGKLRLVSPSVEKVVDRHERTAGSTPVKSPYWPYSQAIAGVNSRDDSYGSKSLLERQTRSDLIDHLELKINSTRVMVTFNISWIHKNITWLPASAKIPFLLITLLDAPEFKASSRGFKAPCVRCADETGPIEAAIDYNFAMNHRYDLTPGTCLAVQNVIFGRRRDKDKVMITITPRSLICMASTRERDGEQDLSQSQEVKFTAFSEFVPDEIWRNYEDLLALKTKIENETEPQQEQPVQKIYEGSTVLDASRRAPECFPPGQNNNGPVQCQPVPNIEVVDNDNIEDDPFFEELDINFDEIDRNSMAM